MICPKCDFENHSQATFCGKCGSRIRSNDKEVYKKPLRNISIFYSILIIFIVTVYISDFQVDYRTSLIVDAVSALIVLIFFFIDFKSVKSALIPKKFKIGLSIFLIFLMIIFSIPIELSVNYLNSVIAFDYEVSYYWIFTESPTPMLLAVFSTGFIPAVFEEIAFRGIIFNNLLKITTEKSTIIISAIMFSLIHFSFISLLWIFPIGLFFGWLRLKHNTIIYGVLCHFFYNVSFVFIEKYELFI